MDEQKLIELVDEYDKELEAEFGPGHHAPSFIGFVSWLRERKYKLENRCMYCGKKLSDREDKEQ